MLTRSRNRRGFTLIEILIVIGIIMALMAAAVVAYMPQQKGARINTTKIALEEVGNAIEMYNTNIGHYPSDQEGGLEALRTKPSFENEATGQNWHGPYLKKEPLDAWGNKFRYTLSQSGTSDADLTPFKLESNGPDGMEGTEDDIKNWSDATTTK